MAGYEKEAERFREAGVRIVALSAEGEKGARAMRDDEGLTFPVLYGLDVPDARVRFGLYVHEDEEGAYLQPAQIVVDPEGEVRFVSYSSGAVGRLGAEEAWTLIPEDVRARALRTGA